MEVILLKRVVKLGQIGDVVKIKDGYGRNFLIPNSIALRATDENKKIFEAKKVQLELDNINLKKEAESVFGKVNNHEVVVIRTAGESGHLYGSVKSLDLATSLNEAGYKVNKSQIIIAHPIKSLGIYTVTLSLHSEVNANILVNVARSLDEAVMQKTAHEKAAKTSVKDNEKEQIEQMQKATKLSAKEEEDFAQDDFEQEVQAEVVETEAEKA